MASGFRTPMERGAEDRMGQGRQTRNARQLTIVDLHDHRFYLDPENDAEVIRRGFARGWYERAEVVAAQATIRPSDRVVELGAGMGIVTCALARIVGDAAVLSFEPNPEIAERARMNFALNGRNIELREKICRPAACSTEPVRFRLADVFWASRIEDEGAEGRPVEVEVEALEPVLAAHGATVLMMDIEGGELEILRHADLGGLRAIVFETHESTVGEDETHQAIDVALRQGFALQRLPDAENIAVLQRQRA